MCNGWRTAARFEGLPQFHGLHSITFKELKNAPLSFIFRLNQLHISSSSPSDDDDPVIANALPYLDGLKKLNLSGTWVKDKTMRLLQFSSVLPALTSLDVSHNCNFLFFVYLFHFINIFNIIIMVTLSTCILFFIFFLFYFLFFYYYILLFLVSYK